MTTTIEGITARKTLRDRYKMTDKQFRKALRVATGRDTNEFSRLRDYTPRQVAHIVELIGPWTVTIRD